MTARRATARATPIDLRGSRRTSDKSPVVDAPSGVCRTHRPAAPRTTGLPRDPVRLRGVDGPSALAPARSRGRHRPAWRTGRNACRRGPLLRRVAGPGRRPSRRPARRMGDYPSANHWGATQSSSHRDGPSSGTSGAGSRSMTGSSGGARGRSPRCPMPWTRRSTGEGHTRCPDRRATRSRVTPGCSGSCRGAGVRTRPGSPTPCRARRGDIAFWLMTIEIPRDRAGSTGGVRRLRMSPLGDLDAGGGVVVGAVTAFRGSASPLAIEPRRTLRIDRPRRTALPVSIDLGQVFRQRPAAGPRPRVHDDGRVIGWGTDPEPSVAGAVDVDLAMAPDATIAVGRTRVAGDRLPSEGKRKRFDRITIEALPTPTQRIEVEIVDAASGEVDARPGPFPGAGRTIPSAARTSRRGQSGPQRGSRCRRAPRG